jgi:XTP/dITP diphosphohydrolase
MKLLVATSNRHKLREIRDIFMMPSVELMSLDEFEDVPEVEEDGETFADNAVKKAVEVARKTECWTMADDSGLEVVALGGRPGVRSARYAGEPADYQANNSKLIEELSGTDNRAARFVCVMALSDPEGYCRTVRGICEGTITKEPRGINGFGYDPVFLPANGEMTFAEMTPEQKNVISHRAAALRKAADEWRDLLEKKSSAYYDDGDVFEKTVLLENEVQAELIDGMLEEKGIPHIIRSYRESAFDGLFQATKGWGHIEAHPRHREAILAMLNDLSHPDTGNNNDVLP